MDPICISWVTTTSAGSSNGDFRSWNAAGTPELLQERPRVHPVLSLGPQRDWLEGPQQRVRLQLHRRQAGPHCELQEHGERFEKIQLPAAVPPPVAEMLTAAVLQNTLNLGALAGRAATAIEGASLMGRTVLDRRVETRHLKPGLWCQERQLVVTEHPAHSAGTFTVAVRRGVPI